MTKELTVLICIAATMAPILAFVLVALRKVSHPLVSTEARADSEWRLGLVVQAGRRYRLCMRYEVAYEGGEDDFGLVVEYLCRTSHGEIRERAGVGSVTPPGRDRYVSTSYRNSYTGMAGRSRQKATFILATIEPFTGPTELTAEGTVRVSQGTALVRGEVFFS